VSDELKTCPFCRGEGEITEWRATRDNSLSAAEIICTDCGARTGEHRIGADSVKSARAAWNRRAGEDKP
jgi:Lar family restriction alleviation protein